jgi:hypothetical protein
MINSQASSVTSLRLYQSAIAARFIFWREIYHPAFQDFCNTIHPEADIRLQCNIGRDGPTGDIPQCRKTASVFGVGPP